MQDDSRIALTNQKIKERLYKLVKARIKSDILVGAIFGVFILVFGLLALYDYFTQNPAFSLILGAGIVLVLVMSVCLISELITISRMKRRIDTQAYTVLRDNLIRANENVYSIQNEIKINTAYRSPSTPRKKDEYIFERGMTYVRLSSEKDEFDLRGIMRYSDQPIPFIIVVYQDRPSIPILLYDERVFRYEEV